MNWGSCSRSIAIATALVATCFNLSSNAQAQTAAASSGVCWINVRNGKPVPKSDIGPFGSQQSDANHATISAAAGPTVPGTSVTFVRGPDGSWSNAANGTPVPPSDLGPFGSQQSDVNHATISAAAGPTVPGTSETYVRVPCPPTNASTTPPMQTGVLPGGTLLPGTVKGGNDTPDKPGGDVKTTEPKTPVKEDKPQQASTPKTGQVEKTVTGKDDKPSKITASKDNLKTTKHLTGPKTATASKTAKQAKTKPEENKTQIHIEFFSTGGRMGGGGFGR